MAGIEEDKLLCSDIELRNIRLHQTTARSAANDGSLGEERYVNTSHGEMCVAVMGDLRRPAILTYHDIGLNYVSTFQGFMNFYDTRLLTENFCFVHLNAPGQQPGAAPLPEGFVYPTCDQLADQVCEIIEQLTLKRVVGFGVGAGGNILTRAAVKLPALFECLCVVNAVCAAPGWIEWGYQKLNVRHLRGSGVTQAVLDYLLWHHFGKLDEAPHDLVQLYTSQFKSAQPGNLAQLIETYNLRTDTAITRPTTDHRREESVYVRVPVLLVCGGRSPHVEDTVTFNSRLDPANSQWMCLQDCSLPLEEQVAKFSEAFRLFLQGQGFIASIGRRMSSDAGFSRR